MIEVKLINNNFQNGEFLPKRKIIEIPIVTELQQDCYLFNSMDAPSEFKIMLLKEVASKIDEIIMNDAPKHIDKQWLINKLNRIKVIDYGTENS